MRIDENHWLLTKPIAHRGLWGGDVPENSTLAYQNAVDNGYPIEIDLYLTKDGKLVSFHDSHLRRMTGENAFIYEKTLAELKALKLKDSEFSIPTFDEVLEICENKTPLLIEIKNQPNKTIVDEVVKRLKNYTGEFCLQSFNPFYILKVKKLAPEFFRGVLGTHEDKESSPFVRWLIKKMPLNRLIKPDFISYNYGGLPLKKSVVKNTGVITWTVTSKEIYDKVKPYAQNIIFEHFMP